MITGSTEDNKVKQGFEGPHGQYTNFNKRINKKNMNWIGEPRYALQSHNKPTDTMTKFYKECGFEVSWDFDRKYHWDELLLNGKMVIQVEQGITKEQFLKAVDDLLENHEADLPFFMASNLPKDKFNKILIKHFKK